jgi:hypothetical protein
LQPSAIRVVALIGNPPEQWSTKMTTTRKLILITGVLALLTGCAGASSPSLYSTDNCDGRGITPSTECLKASGDYDHFPAPHVHGYRDIFEQACYSIVSGDLDNRGVRWTPHERRDVHDSPLMKKCVTYLGSAKDYGDLDHRIKYETLELDLKLVKKRD